MIKPTVPMSIGVSSIHYAIMQIGREYGAPFADSRDKADVYTLICGEGEALGAQRAIGHPELADFTIRLIVVPPDAWPVDARWILARKGHEGVISEGI